LNSNFTTPSRILELFRQIGVFDKIKQRAQLLWVLFKKENGGHPLMWITPFMADARLQSIKKPKRPSPRGSIYCGRDADAEPQHELAPPNQNVSNSTPPPKKSKQGANEKSPSASGAYSSPAQSIHRPS